jgi:hypothetical protein
VLSVRLEILGVLVKGTEVVPLSLVDRRGTPILALKLLFIWISAELTTSTYSFDTRAKAIFDIGIRQRLSNMTDRNRIGFIVHRS